MTPACLASVLLAALAPLLSLEPKGRSFEARELKPFGRAFTMTALVKPELPVVHDVRPGIVAKWGAGWWAGAQLMIRPVRTGGYSPILRIGRKKLGPVEARNDDVVLEAGRWVRLTGVCDGRHATLYVNGRQVAATAFETGWSDAEFDLRFCVGNAGFNFAGWPAYPVLCDSAAIWGRAFSARDVAALPSAAFEGDTPEIVSFFRLRDGRGQPLTAQTLADWRARHAVSPRCAQALDELETIVRVARDDLDGAAEKFRLAKASLEKMCAEEREPLMPSPVTLFRDRYLAALEDFAPTDVALRAVESDCRRVAEEAPTCLPMAEARLAALYRRAGRVAEAERLEKKILSSDLRLYPQLAAKFGKPYAATAGAAEGARVSSRAPSAAYYVSPTGDDAADGSAAHPFKTLLRARDAVRAHLKAGIPEGGLDIGWQLDAAGDGVGE